ncbi:helix-turn-helix domain-containing protein [Microtetraspora malaysiensis]|uniref:helix-turn-helix domain-containing protein n=1 Tax=Microtetraspora malaysiensis TaxID=161358 RepID=UPI003D948CCF
MGWSRVSGFGDVVCSRCRARKRRQSRPWALFALLAQPDATIASIAQLLGVSRATIYKYVPELKTGQRPQLEAGAPAPAELPAS